jgi:hypothetical protein
MHTFQQTHCVHTQRPYLLPAKSRAPCKLVPKDVAGRRRGWCQRNQTMSSSFHSACSAVLALRPASLLQRPPTWRTGKNQPTSSLMSGGTEKTGLKVTYSGVNRRNRRFRQETTKTGCFLPKFRPCSGFFMVRACLARGVRRPHASLLASAWRRPR